jgi:hypothetical protein
VTAANTKSCIASASMASERARENGGGMCACGGGGGEGGKRGGAPHLKPDRASMARAHAREKRGGRGGAAPDAAPPPRPWRPGPARGPPPPARPAPPANRPTPAAWRRWNEGTRESACVRLRSSIRRAASPPCWLLFATGTARPREIFGSFARNEADSLYLVNYSERQERHRRRSNICGKG